MNFFLSSDITIKGDFLIREKTVEVAVDSQLLLLLLIDQ